jgi:hypothetical protein
MRARITFFAVLTLLAGVLAAGAGAAANPGILPPQSHPYGLSYSEWQGRFWQWTESVPVPQNPAFDQTGALCGTAQQGHVWFTTASVFPTVDRTCAIPAGTALFVLVIANECSSLEPPPFFGTTEPALQACATSGYDAFFGGLAVSVTIDGRPVEDLASYRSVSPAVQVTLPAENIWGVPGGSGLAAGDGIFLMLAPMSVGSHRIEITIPIPGAFTFEEDYTIVVQPH